MFLMIDSLIGNISKVSIVEFGQLLLMNDSLLFEM